MILKCSYSTPTVKPNKKQLTEPRREQLKKRIEQMATKLTLAGSKATDMQKRVDMAKQQFAHNFIDLHDMTNKRANPWDRFLAVYLGENVGDVGKFRQQLFENKRYAEGLLHALENQATTKAIRPLTDRFKELAKLRGVKTEKTGQLMTDLFEVGRTPVQLQLHGKTPAVQQLLQARNARWVEAMHKAGFNDVDIDELAKLAHTAGASFDDIHATIEALGKELPLIENVEYLPRIFSREAEDWFRSKKVFGDNTKPPFLKGASEYKADFAKSRNSVWYTVEDHDALADLLGLDKTELSLVISDTAKFKSYVDEALGDEMKDMLVDSGIISRVPMTSSEFYEWYSTRYDMPFKSYDELLVTNPEKILKGYTQELEQAASNWGMLKSVKEQGVGKGFVVDESTAITEGLENFTRVSQMKTASLLKEAGVDGEAFMHKDAAAVLDAALHIERNPSALNTVARSWLTLQGLIKNQMLSTPQYVSRIFLSDTFMYAAHGGEMHEVATSMVDMFKYLTKGLDAFDNSKPFRVVNGQQLTHRQFVEMFATRRLTNITPMFDGTKRPVAKMEALNPLLAGKKISLMHRMVMSRETMPEMLGQLWRETGYTFSDFIKAVYQPFAFTANFIETAFKLGLFKSVTKRGDAWDGIRSSLRYVTSAEGSMYDNVDEALQHVDRAFLTMDDMGEIPGNISRYLVPFFSYTWKSSSAIVRDAVRNPVKYMQYARMGSMVFDRIEEQNDMVQGEQFAPLNNDMAIPVYRDDKGRAVVLSLTNVHPILGFTQSVTSNVDKFARLMGIPMGTAEEVRSMLSEKHGIKSDGTPSNLADKLGDVLGSIYAVQLGSLAMGKDQKGRAIDDSKYNTFLGVEMSQTSEALVGFVFPLLKTLNRYNPLGMFGSREEVSNAGTIGLDSQGNIKYGEGEKIREAKPSIFGTDRTDLDQKQLVDTVTKNPSIFLAQLAGLSFIYNDKTRNLKYTYQDVTSTQREISTAWKKYDTQIKEGKLPERQRSIAQQRQEDLLKLYGVFEYDRLRMQAYMASKGITPKEFDVKVRDKKLSLQGIPQLSLKETYQVQKAMEVLQDGDR